MKKAIFLPILGILAITLWSFAPAPQANHIITGANGEAIIPSTCNISVEDQNFILNTVQSYGPEYGYLVYRAADGSVQHYGSYFGDPVNPEALQWVDAQNPGSNLAAYQSFSGEVIIVSSQTRQYPGNLNEVITTTKLADIYAQIGPVLKRYGYQPPQ